MMEGCELVVGITALAIAIAAQIEDINDLTVIGAAFTQLGDTLAIIAAQRARCAARQEEEESDQAANKEETPEAQA